MSSYLLPAAGIPATPSARTELVESALRITLLLAVPAILVLVVGKGPLIRLLYSAEFGEARNIVRWMLIGEFFRATGWIAATTGYARGHVLGYGIIEAIWAFVFVLFSVLLMSWGSGPEAVGIAYMLAHASYAATWVWYAQWRGIFRPSVRTVLLWLAGLGVVVLASAATWSVSFPGVLTIVLIAVACAAFCFGLSTKSEQRELAALVTRVTRRGSK
jgi:PST family polysaccharide transporter